MNDKTFGMRAALWLAAAVIAAVGVASFVLSFAALRELAQQAHVPARWAWLFPVIVDGTIVQATVSMVALANSPQRGYFLKTLASGAAVSIAGNSLHAAVAGHELPWWVCALVAAIAPVSLLVDTHGLAVLFRATQQDAATSKVEAPVAEPVSEPVKPVARKAAVRPRRDPVKVKAAVAMRAEGKSYAAIATALGISARTAANYAPDHAPVPSHPVPPVAPVAPAAPVPAPVAVAPVRPRPMPVRPMPVPAVGGAR